MIRRVFIRHIGLSTIGANFIFNQNKSIQELFVTKNQSLPRSNPEDQGVSLAAIHRYFDAIEKSNQEFHSTIVVKNGFVIAEAYWFPYAPDHKMQLYSMSKSFTSTAIGLAQQEGLLSVEDPVLTYFKDVLPENISENLQKLKIKHLLMMGVGMAKDSIMTIEKSPPGTPWAKTFLSLPIDYEPGAKFLYNSGASYMLSCILQRITGRTMGEYLKPRLFDPLGMSQAVWSVNNEGINYGASHLRITSEDMAKFGQFYLQEGKWNGKQILNSEYVKAASSKQISNGNNNSAWNYGYGYQFWLNPVGGFRADGAYGQYSMIFPEQNAVVSIGSESIDKAATMNTVWNTLWPELNKNQKLMPDDSANAKLKQRLSKLRFAPPIYSTSSLSENRLQNKTFKIDKNDLGIESMTFLFGKDTISFRIKEEGIPAYQIFCGRNHWLRKGNFKPREHSLFSRRRIDFDSRVAASAGWSNDNTLEITMRFIETCHGDSLTCLFDEDRLVIRTLFSASRLEKKEDGRAALVGFLNS